MCIRNRFVFCLGRTNAGWDVRLAQRCRWENGQSPENGQIVSVRPTALDYEAVTVRQVGFQMSRYPGEDAVN